MKTLTPPTAARRGGQAKRSSTLAHVTDSLLDQVTNKTK